MGRVTKHKDRYREPGRPSTVTPEIVAKLKNTASMGERPYKRIEQSGISKDAYYRHLEKNPELRDELTRLCWDFQMAKIKEAALIGAPEREQRYHANKMTELEYQELMEKHPEFYEDIKDTEANAMKLWSRKNIANSIQTQGNVGDSWRYLEHTDEQMNKTKIEISSDKEKSDEEKALIRKYENEHKDMLRKRIPQK